MPRSWKKEPHGAEGAVETRLMSCPHACGEQLRTLCGFIPSPLNETNPVPRPHFLSFYFSANVTNDPIS